MTSRLQANGASKMILLLEGCTVNVIGAQVRSSSQETRGVWSKRSPTSGGLVILDLFPSEWDSLACRIRDVFAGVEVQQFLAQVQVLLFA